MNLFKLSIASVLILIVTSTRGNQPLYLIPQPVSIDLKKGSFNLSDQTKVFVPDEYRVDLEPYLKEKFRLKTCKNIQVLDVARHFRPKEFVLKQIDIFSSYKINKFHWHLSDDQGWRIESKKFPNLTKKGAWRADRTGIAWWSREPAKPEEPKT